jgi:signal transduction histidine kinase
MAMHRSEEVTGVAVSLNEELLKLGFEGGSTIIIMDKETGGTEQWTGFSEDKSLKSCSVPYFKHPCHDAQLNAWKNGEEFLVYTLAGDEKRSLDEHYFTTGYKDFPESDKRWMRQMESVTFSHAFMKYGAIHWGPGHLTEDQLRILQRFSKVFEQSYTRFLDLQKAEAQAREAQIEAALERVRSRTMAMHKSEELLEVIVVVSEQLQQLKFKFHNVSFGINSEDYDIDFWLAVKGQKSPFHILVPYVDTPMVNRVKEAQKNGLEFFADTLTAKENSQWLKHLFDNVVSDFLTEEIKQYVLNSVGYSRSTAIMKNIFFTIGNYAAVPYSDEENAIFRRFAKVFEQSYTRFLDLQKAEAQAREAKIEAAVEKVRSRSLAMHKSDELQEVVHTVFERLKELNVDFYTAIIILFKEGAKDIIWWLESKANQQYPKMLVPFTPIPYFNDLFETRESGGDFFSKCYSFDEKNELFSHLFQNTDFKYVPETQKQFLLGAGFATISVALARKTGIHITSYSKKSFSDEDNQIIKRFANVFDQAYTRFLDLQKAEAQAREAEIELALERVRSRAMAMHSSQELKDVATELRNQMSGLGQTDMEICAIHLYDESADYFESIAAGPVFDPTSKAIQVQVQVKLPKHGIQIIEEMMNQYHSGKKDYVLVNHGKKGVEWFELLKEKVPLAYEFVIQNLKETSLEELIYYWSISDFKGGSLVMTTYVPPADEVRKILRRFANVFGLAYQRFKDLKKAEAQAKEAQIEAALERVRSRTMAMHKSDELAEVATVLFEQMSLLDNTPDRFNIRIVNEAEGVFEFWATDQEGHLVNKFFRAAFDGSPVVLQMYTSWKAKEKILIQDLHGDQLSEWVHYIRDELGVPFNTNRLKEHRFLSSIFFSHGMIGITTNDTPNPVTLQLIERFAKVFEQTYTRFLDLQRAEAQARDAQIEVALERVRAKVMAMTNSNELNGTSLVFGEQLRKLGIDWQFSYFWLIDEAKNENTFWITWPDNKTSFTTYTLAEAEAYFNDCLISWRAGVKIHDNYVPPEGVQEWLDTFQRIADDAGGEAKKIMVPDTFANGVYYYDAMMKYGSFGICISKPATEEEKKIQCRFAIEFERAYTRFLDLKQAEAQAREARIEVALERVRAKAMAMHKSDDLKMAVATVFEELDKLDLGLIRCGIAILDKDKPRGDIWITIKSDQHSTIEVSGDEPLDIHPLLKGAYDSWLNQQDFSYVLQDDDLLSYYKAITKANFQLAVSPTLDPEKKDQPQYYFNAVFQDGSLFAFLDTPFTAEAKMVMKRFANVFNLTYKRFLDLQKAEAQAREAQIELGLERVRARAMAMQKSVELKELIATVSTELSKLDIILDRCFIMTYDIKTLGVTWWMANPETSSDPIGLYVQYHEQAPYLAFLKAWQDRVVKWQYLLEGSVKKTWDEFLFVETELSRLPGFVIDNMRANDKVYLSASFNNFGCLTLATLEPLSDEQFDIMLRFAKVFDLTYTRFNDLKQAEAQARAAKIEAALERVRARALAMQEPEELKDVARVLRTEMGLLGVEELETCSIYINDESAEKAECWYALKDIREDEKKLVSDHFALNLNDTWVGREMLQFYKADTKQVSIVMTGDIRKEWIRYCEEKSFPFRGYYGEVIPDRTYHLYKFSHGAIGAAAAGDISEESWRMLSRAASVFSLAYSRFKDLTQARIDLIKLKEEKKRAEEALTELQATQKQLVQSEKMASLGELTAGIAHEIQNPLNFVNNFSDVSNELLEEMKQELATGNTQQAIEIVNGVKENLEKILHHGKRADAIVKGMLQHSRSSSGQKELTDINTLAEEYLRLAYHGLRAKDKSFNAKFETHLDPSINKINVVPQEIGRVILNLINNAFYAVTEKKRSLPPSPNGVQGKTFNDYEPKVTVTTKRLGPPLVDRDSVEIRVADNGNGIPQKVLDKIFQPFFTTKPTGQGTGLGLSLSYDIIKKGHDGEIKVETKEGEGSAFTICLPMK